MARKTTGPTGRCHECKKLVGMTKAGTLRWHSNGQARKECPGVGSQPVTS